MYDTCRDELISIFSSYGHDIVIENCTLIKKFYPSYYTNENTDKLVDYTHFMITDHHVNTGENTKPGRDDHITIFENCKILCKPISDEQQASSMYFITGDNQNPTYDFLKFNNCDIELQKIHSMGYGGYNNTVSSALELEDYAKLFFNSCNIKIIDVTSDYGLFHPSFWNTYFTNCFIECQNIIMNSFYQDTVNGSNPFTMYMKGNRIRVKKYSKSNALFTINKIAKNNICLVNNEFIVTNENGIEEDTVLYKYEDAHNYSEDTVKLYSTAKYKFYSNGNRINYKSIETAEIIEGKSD